MQNENQETKSQVLLEILTDFNTDKILYMFAFYDNTQTKFTDFGNQK